MWMLNGCLYDYFPRDGIVLTQEQKSAITAATTAYKATSELFPDNNFGEFEFMYVFAFLESRYGETIGYDVTEDVIRAEFQLLGEYYTEIKNIGACTLFCVSYLRHRWPRKRSSKCVVV